MDLISHRRALHRIPELDAALPETLSYLRSVLEPLPCALSSPTPGSLCAFFDFGRPDTLGFRADMDALPIEEASGLSFSSCHKGKMHACGHDGHMAILLGLAQWAGQCTSLPHNLLLIFQPAEETTGGAKPICHSGILQQHHVTALFGLHLWPDIPAGQIATRPGSMMCRSTEVTLDVMGRSVHVAHAESGADALEAAARWYLEALSAERQYPGHAPRLLKFGHITAGTVRNAIAGSARLEGTLRSFDDKTFFALRAELEHLAQKIAGECGCSLSLSFSEGYPAVDNDPALYQRVSTLAEIRCLKDPVRIAEDFSWYQRYVPGLFFFLGCGPAPALHSPDFNFDENVLSAGLKLFQTIAREV